MISFGNAASSYSGLIPLKTAYRKREEFHWAIASKKKFRKIYLYNLVLFAKCARAYETWKQCQ